LPVFWDHSSQSALMKAPPVPLESAANRIVAPAPKLLGAINEAARIEPNKRRMLRLVRYVFESIAGAFPGWGELFKL
jgi:hypothetical protein